MSTHHVRRLYRRVAGQPERPGVMTCFHGRGKQTAVSRQPVAFTSENVSTTGSNAQKNPPGPLQTAGGFGSEPWTMTPRPPRANPLSKKESARG
jgi:hypothetical protein